MIILKTHTLFKANNDSFLYEWNSSIQFKLVNYIRTFSEYCNLNAFEHF